MACFVSDALDCADFGRLWMHIKSQRIVSY